MSNNKPPTTSKQINPNLLYERSRATFTPIHLTHLLDGGSPSLTNRRRHLESIISSDPTGIFSNDLNPYLHRTERHVRALAKHVRLVEICRHLGIGDDYDGDILLDPDFSILLQSLGDDLPTSLHWVMFVPNIMALGDDEQQRTWLPLCRDWKMVGCYAQTELGHGSNVRALETTATFVVPSPQHPDGAWEIHSPTITAAKFWPGTLGRTANHAMVIARLIDGDGRDRGMHNFLVPLRSMTTHELLPGVTTGDIGPKIGYNNMDNGFAIFKNVIIPRRNMAMKFATVDRKGRYEKIAVSDATSKISYVTMMYVRAHIINESGKQLAMATCVAIRYSVVRRQGYDADSGNDGTKAKTEVPILDYTQQQHRLLPLVAAGYCFFFTGRKVLERLMTTQERLTTSSSSSLGITKTEVADLHASTSALKSFCTTVAADGIEDCRKACGGHGFLMASGLPELLGSYLQNPTVEGDNYMLPQQAVRVLLKLVQLIATGGDLTPYDKCDSKYLIQPLQQILSSSSPHSCPATTKNDLLDLSLLIDAFQYRSASLLLSVASTIQNATSEGGKTQSQAWNESLVEMTRVSRAHSQALLLANFHEGIMSEANNTDSSVISNAEVKVLTDLALLYGLYWMERDMGDFLEIKYLSPSQTSWVRSAVRDMLSTIRPNAVALVDARDISDFRLKSALGRHDGNVYEAIMESARKDPLNKEGVGPGYKEHLRRLYVDGVGVAGTVSRL